MKMLKSSSIKRKVSVGRKVAPKKVNSRFGTSRSISGLPPSLRIGISVKVMMSDHAVAAGLFPVGGAGNFRMNQPIPVQHQSPKDVPSVISVGGIDTLGVLVSFSSMGPAEWSSIALYGDYPMPDGLVKPDLVAFPGSGFPVLGLEDVGYIDTDTLRIRGNSFSGPQVAGVAALILSEQPSMSVWQVREIIERSAHDLGAPGKDNMFGYGLADAYAAVVMARVGVE